MQDTPRRWLVLSCTFLTMFLGSSLFSATGVIHIALIESFEESVEETAWAGSLFSGFFCLSAPFAGILINMFSCRACIITGGILNLFGFVTSSVSPNLQILYVTYGFIGGTGQSLCYAGSYVATGFYFEKQRSLAVGFTVAGFAVGMMVFPTLAQYILDVYALRGTFLLLGAIGFQVCVFGALIFPHPLELEIQKTLKRRDSNKSIRNRINAVCGHFKVLKNTSFLLFCASIFFWSKSLALTSLYLPDYYSKSGSSRKEAALLTSIVGVGSIFSRILTGFAAVDRGIDSEFLYFGSYVIIGTTTVTLYMYGYSFSGKVIYSVLFGLYTGGTWTLLGPINVSILGLPKLATGFSINMLTAGVGFIIGPVIGSFILGAERSYSSLFIYSGTMHYLSALCGLLMTLTMDKHDYNFTYNENEEDSITVTLKSQAQISHNDIASTSITQKPGIEDQEPSETTQFLKQNGYLNDINKCLDNVRVEDDVYNVMK